MLQSQSSSAGGHYYSNNRGSPLRGMLAVMLRLCCVIFTLKLCRFHSQNATVHFFPLFSPAVCSSSLHVHHLCTCICAHSVLTAVVVFSFDLVCLASHQAQLVRSLPEHKGTAVCKFSACFAQHSWLCDMLETLLTSIHHISA